LRFSCIRAFSQCAEFDHELEVGVLCSERNTQSVRLRVSKGMAIADRIGRMSGKTFANERIQSPLD